MDKARTTSTVQTDCNKKVNYSEDENQERGNWSGKLEFVLSCLGYAVGLGNIWRFPYLCYKNGGGAFLVPYATMLLICGLPCFFMELAIGQFTSLGPVGIWNISPVFRGIGFGMVILNGFVALYYNVLVSYALHYLVSSFTTHLPWSSCNNTWNSEYCSETDASALNAGDVLSTNITGNESFQIKYPAEEYWEKSVLGMSAGIEYSGQLKWDLCLCLLGAWIMVFLCLIKGIKSSGKVVYFTATFPYLVLLIMLIRGLTLPGSANGIKFYILPDWNRLKHPEVWGDAAIQIFFSLGTSFGTLIVLSSYNRFHNNCYRDALVVAIANCLTSILAGFVIFSVIGFMAHKMQVTVADVSRSGPGLAFVVYPAAISMMPGAPFWAVLFFFMVCTLGLDSMFAMMEATLTTLGDINPRYFRENKMWTTAGCCLVFFLLGLPQCTEGGIYWMYLIDNQATSFSLLIVGFMEVCVIMHVYGCDRFCEDIQHMLGFYPGLYWRVTWKLLAPLSLLLIFVFSAWVYKPMYLNDYIYPPWAQALGWLLVVSSVVLIPVIAIFTWVQHARKTGNLTRCNLPILRSISKPNPEWGPALEKHRLLTKCKHVTGQTTNHNGPFQCTNLAYDESKSRDISHDTYI